MNQEQTCPNCDRHCPVTALHCDRGRSYFGMEALPEDARGKHGRQMRGGRNRHEENGHGDVPRVLQLLRQCGHVLHHGADEPEALIAPLSEREIETLEYLLGKCLNRSHR